MQAEVQPPEKVCLLRLSAIGDTCHVVPLLRTLQDAWPRTRFTWVIGKLEAKLMSLIPDVELITLDKGAGLGAYARLREEMQRRGAFDLLLHLQLSIRAKDEEELADTMADYQSAAGGTTKLGALLKEQMNKAD